MNPWAKRMKARERQTFGLLFAKRRTARPTRAGPLISLVASFRAHFVRTSRYRSFAQTPALRAVAPTWKGPSSKESD